jgi:hypothetical protein
MTCKFSHLILRRTKSGSILLKNGSQEYSPQDQQWEKKHKFLDFMVDLQIRHSASQIFELNLNQKKFLIVLLELWSNFILYHKVPGKTDFSLHKGIRYHIKKPQWQIKWPCLASVCKNASLSMSMKLTEWRSCGRLPHTRFSVRPLYP